jgi:hypothetical protein
MGNEWNAFERNLKLDISNIQFEPVICTIVDHSGRAVWGINCLHPSNTRIVVSNLTEGMDVCVRLFCVCVT